MVYTVKQLANLAGVSVRTLHHYDQIGVLKPAFIKENGYRYYSDTQLMTLQQILFFRELEFPLDKIRQMMSSPEFDELAAFQDQRRLLELKKKKLERLLETIGNSIEQLSGEKTMTDTQAFSAFNDPSYQQYKNEVEERWGQSEAYQQSVERVGKLNQEEFEQIKAEAAEINTAIVKLMTDGKSATSPAVQEQVARFYEHLKHFYEPNYQVFTGLTDMYVTDPRFTKYYEDQAEGLAKFMKDAMLLFAEENLK